MRIVFGLMCIVLVATVAASASSGVRIGLKGGLSIAQADHGTASDEITTYDQRTGYGAGMELDVVASPSVCFELDLLYLQKGSTAQAVYRDGNESEGSNIYFDTDTRLDYIVFAPMIRFTAARSGFAPYLQIGGEFGYLVGATAIVESHREGSTEGPTYENDITEYYQDTDFGICFGGGFEIPARSYALFFEGRYSLGLTDIGQEVDGVTVERKNRGIYILGGLRF